MFSSLSRPAKFAWGVLAYNIAVILWGAYVRASGSGAGCGEHWPLCNGVVLPRDPSIATLIEFSHRITSGLALIAVVALLVWVRRVCPPGHPSRRAAGWTVFFMLTEAAVGAGLVLFQLVADNATMARAMFMAVHLLNTFVLLGWLTLTAWWLSGGEPVSSRRHSGRAAALALAAAGLLLVGASGAVAALGNTLYPDTSLAEGFAADLSTTSHFLIRLRILHPTFAVLTAVGLLLGASRLASGRSANTVKMARIVAGLAGLQLVLGAANVILLAPVWMQMIHLLVADLLWIAFVLLGASVLAIGVEASVRHGRARCMDVPIPGVGLD
ncbi:MAG: COX15/CtaA family protein [Acidobacteriota bacterium]|nr:COX15/CtaA family protein [Acidobacteriota bacterium]